MIMSNKIKLLLVYYSPKVLVFSNFSKIALLDYSSVAVIMKETNFFGASSDKLNVGPWAMLSGLSIIRTKTVGIMYVTSDILIQSQL